MPTLNWIGKDKVVNHHLDVPFCTLEKQYTYASEGRDDGGNMIIHGDNLYALKVPPTSSFRRAHFQSTWSSDFIHLIWSPALSSKI